VPAVNFDFMDRRSAERFAELLDETSGGRHHNRGPADEQLAELVAIGHSLSAAKPGVRVDPEFRVGLRAMLVATAERDGIGRTAGTVEPEPIAGHAVATGTGARARFLGRGGRRIRARGAIVIGVAAGAMAVSGISAASENASPGDALYGVKRSTERAQLAMAGSDVTRGQLSLDFARTRLAEAAAMPGGDSGFGGVLDDMDADTRKGVKLLTTAAVARKDVKPLSTVNGFADTQRRTITSVLDKLTATNRGRALASVGLLDDVQQRAGDLRDGLNCSTVSSNGSDALGPKLRDCTVGADSSSSPVRQPGHSGKSTTKSGKDAKVKPERTDPATAPDATAGTPAPDLQNDTPTGTDLVPLDGSTPADTGAPARPGAPADTGTDTGDDTDGGGLGGLLGGIFGGK
jgi:hypothetical protein